LQERQRAADQRGGEEAVLPGGDVPERGGKSERDQDAGAAAENAGDRSRVGAYGRREPADGGGQIRQRRQRRGNEEGSRRIVPAVIILEVVADGADFGLFVQRPVVRATGSLASVSRPAAITLTKSLAISRPCWSIGNSPLR
jgi:hypothetical protein